MTNNKQYLRIAMLGQKRIPSREGGIEVVVEEISTRMVALGHDVTCYNRRGNHISGKEFDTDNFNEYKGVVLKTVLTLNKRGFAAMTSSVFATIQAAMGKYDIVHYHAEGPCAMMWFSKLFGKYCVATIHGLDHQRSKWGRLASAYIMMGEKVAVKFADEIIVLSEGVQNYFMEKYGRETKFIPNGVKRPIKIKPELIVKQFGLEKNGYILFLGRLVPEKGLRYLVQAFKQIDTDKMLVIAGGGSDTNEFVSELKKMADGDGRIIFTGFVQGQLLEELYSNAYIYTLPSDLEGMPLSLLEAMSYGNCCVVSDIDECVAVIDDKAVVFERGNVCDLKKKLQKLCDNINLVYKYKNEASDFICKKYSWDDVVKQTLDIYKR